MRLAPLLAAAALAAAPASADAAVTVGSSLPEPDDAVTCGGEMSCTHMPTLLNGSSVEVPHDGVIVRWRARHWTGAGAPSDVTFRAARPGAGAFSGVGASPAMLAADGSVVTTATRIPVKRGDRIAISLQDGETLGIASHAAFDAESAFFVPELQGTGTPVASGPDDFEFLFNADVEPDADGDGYGDETQDSCPQRATEWLPSCLLPLSLTAAAAHTAVVGRPTSVEFTATLPPPPSGRRSLLAEPVTLSIALPPGFDAVSAAGGRELTCQTTTGAVTCTGNRSIVVGLPERRVRVEIGGTPSAAFFSRVAPAARSLRFTGTASTAKHDPDPSNNTAVVEQRVTDGRCAVNLTRRGNKRGNRVRGTLFGDLIAGRAGADRLTGGAGRDCINGGSGADLLRGGPGRDTLRGSTGDDRIAARGGTRDVVACGPGDDLAVVDRRDRVSRCERVRRR